MQEIPQSLSIDEVKTFFRKGKAWGKFFSFPALQLAVSSWEILPYPFLSCLLARLLARGRVMIRDSKGWEQQITAAFLLALFREMGTDLLSLPSLLKKSRRQWRKMLSVPPSEIGPPDVRLPPVYLRTDLFFGVPAGGSVSHTAGVLRALKEVGPCPVFLSTDPNPLINADIPTRLILPKRNFADFREAWPLSFNQTFIAKAKSFLQGTSFSFFYQRLSLNNFSGAYLSEFFRKAFVLEYNGSEVWANQNWGRPLLFPFLAEHIESLNFRLARLIVVVSQPLEDELIRRGVPPGKILVNPNGVDPEIYHPEVGSGNLAETLGLSGKKVIGFIGTFGRWHGVEILVEAFGRLMKEFPEWSHAVRLLLVGRGQTFSLARDTAKAWNLSDKVVFTGEVPQAKGPQYLSLCHIAVCPTIKNPDGSPFFGSPTKVFEYMAMGKAIVASDIGQVGQILRHRETALLVPPGDPEALSRALDTLLRSPDFARTLGTRARQIVCQNYTWKHHVQRILHKLQKECGE